MFQSLLNIIYRSHRCLLEFSIFPICYHNFILGTTSMVLSKSLMATNKLLHISSSFLSISLLRMIWDSLPLSFLFPCCYSPNCKYIITLNIFLIFFHLPLSDNLLGKFLCKFTKLFTFPLQITIVQYRFPSLQIFLHTTYLKVT